MSGAAQIRTWRNVAAGVTALAALSNMALGVFLTQHAARTPDAGSGHIHAIQLATNLSDVYLQVFVGIGMARAYKASLVVLGVGLFAILFLVQTLQNSERATRLRLK